MYSSIFFAFFPTVSTQCPRHQNSRFRYLNFAFPHFWQTVKDDLPLRYPIIPETENLGGIEISMRAVGADLGLVDDDPLPFAQLPENLADLQPLEAVEFLPPVLRRENYVVLTVPAGVR